MKIISQTCVQRPSRDPEFVAVVDRWLLFRGNFMSWNLKMGLQNSGRQLRFDCMCSKFYQGWVQV